MALWLTGCTSTPVERYEDLLHRHVGTSKRADVDKILGQPTSCKKLDGYEMCEYRTAAARNEPVPIVHIKEPGYGPDLTPYDSFDVLHLNYDSFGILKDWTAVVVRP